MFAGITIQPPARWAAWDCRRRPFEVPSSIVQPCDERRRQGSSRSSSSATPRSVTLATQSAKSGRSRVSVPERRGRGGGGTPPASPAAHPPLLDRCSRAPKLARSARSLSGERLLPTPDPAPIHQVLVHGLWGTTDPRLKPFPRGHKGPADGQYPSRVQVLGHRSPRDVLVAGPRGGFLVSLPGDRVR